MNELDRTGLAYFAFGSNMLSSRLAQRCPSATKLSVGLVRGFRLCFDKKGWTDGSGKCRLQPASEVDCVWGVLYTIHGKELTLLDDAEGVGRGYEIDRHVVQTPDSQPVQSFAYQAQTGFVDPALRPFDWYLDLVVAGGEEHGLPTDYVESLRSAPSVPDRDLERAAPARKLLRERLSSANSDAALERTVRTAGRATPERP